MATNWIAVSGKDIAAVLNLDIIKKANQNLDPENQPANSETDTDEANRRDELVLECIREVRAAIQTGGRYPLAVTPDTVPPGFKRIVLNMAAWQLINSTPNLNMAILTQNGVSTPFAKFYDESTKVVDGLRKGSSFPLPTDPTGQDYTNAISDTNPAITGVQWGDITADDSDYEQGYFTTSGGVDINLPVDDMRTF